MRNLFPLLLLLMELIYAIKQYLFFVVCTKYHTRNIFHEIFSTATQLRGKKTFCLLIISDSLIYIVIGSVAILLCCGVYKHLLNLFKA